MIAPEEVSVYVPSHDRPALAAGLLTALLPMAIVVVAEQEYDTYRRHGIPETRLRTHPNLFGLAAIRNHIVQQSPTRVTIQVDDDLQYVSCVTGKRVRVIRAPETLHNLFLATATVAQDAGVCLFGWGDKARPEYFRPSTPFSFLGPVSQALGTIGKDVVWDERLITVCDIDATLRELEVRRIVWIDQRFYFHCRQMFQNKGGLQNIRTKALRERDLAVLEQKWGGYLDVRTKTKAGLSHNKIKVKR